MKHNNKALFLFGFIMLLGFSSCQVTNKYKTPELDTKDLYGQFTSGDTTTIADISWREYFSDPLLLNLIEEGLANNRNLQMAYARIKQAEASLGMAKAAYFPSLALVGQVDHSRASNGAQGKDVLGYNSTAYTLGVSASWELDVWGKLNRQSRAKYAQFLNSQAGKNLIQTSLIANIATSYYSLMALDEKLKITEMTVKLLQENVETMIDLKEAGLQNGAAVEQSKSLLYGTQTTLFDLKNMIHQMENALCSMLGRDPGAISRSSIHQQRHPEQMAYGVPAQMLSKRPDVQQAELSFRSAFELVNAAQASFYPSITLNSGTIGYGAASLSQFFRPENLFASIIGGLTQPLFARKQLLGNLEIAKAQQEETLLAFEQTVIDAGLEVSDILFRFDNSFKKNEPRKNQIESSYKAVSYTKDLLIAAVANYTEVLNAEQNLLSALLSQVDDKLEQLQCTVDLYRALGGGVE